MEIIVIIAGLALLAGALAAWPFLRSRPGLDAPPSSEPAAELRQELEARYQGLAELDEDMAAGKLSLEDHSRLKADLEQAAAALLSRTEALEAARRTPAPSRARQERRPSAEPRRERWLARPAVLAAGAVLFLLLGLGLGLFLSGLLTSPSPPPPRASPAARIARLERELRANPTDVKKLLALGHIALDEGELSKAISAYKEVLTLEPDNVEAITHTGLVLFLSGHVDQALSHLDRALALDPTYAHAHWDKANILYHAKQDYAGAIEAWEAFLVLIPSGKDADRARAMVAEAKARALLPRPTGAQSSKPGAALRRPLSPALFTGKAAQAYQV
ncbi:MAG: tetratricopeptide repeat protein, partial [Anaerolineae bacterium]